MSTDTGSIDVSGEAIHWNPNKSYGDYLRLQTLFDCQRPVTPEHDEMMFIVIHQATELWLKLCNHEVAAAMVKLQDDELGAAFKMLARVSRIQNQLIQSWEILATMTPSEYIRFRDGLGQSSGFQSFQYRSIEFRLGNKNAAMIEAHRNDAEHYGSLRRTLESPSLYDLSLKTLARRGFSIPTSHLDRDWSEPYRAHADVEAVWHKVYDDPEKFWDLYELAEKLVDVEYHFHLWRFSHLKTVERIIGRKRGTGGTSGVDYLVKALGLRFFPEIWDLRTSL